MAVDYVFDITGLEPPSANRKAKLSLRDHLKILLWNVIEAFNEDSELYVAVRSGKDVYKVNDAFSNPLGVSHKIVDCYKALEDYGLLEVRKGNFARNGYAGKSRCTRIRATLPLICIIQNSLQARNWVDYNKDRPRLVLREKNMVPSFTKKGRRTMKRKNEIVEFVSNDMTAEMAYLLCRYQKVLDRHNISVSGFSGNYVTWPVKKKRAAATLFLTTKCVSTNDVNSCTEFSMTVALIEAAEFTGLGGSLCQRNCARKS